MWSVPCFLREPAKVALSKRVTAGKKNDQQVGKLRLYVLVVKYLFKRYATDVFIAEAKATITNYEHPVGITTVQYYQARYDRALRCGMIYNEARLKAIFIKGLHAFICYSVGIYCGANYKATIQNLVRHTTSLLKLRENTGALT